MDKCALYVISYRSISPIVLDIHLHQWLQYVEKFFCSVFTIISWSWDRIELQKPFNADRIRMLWCAARAPEFNSTSGPTAYPIKAPSASIKVLAPVPVPLFKRLFCKL